MNEPTITLAGNVAAKPSLRPVEGPSGVTAVASFRVGVTPRRRGRTNEEWADGETMWFGVSAWRATAQNCVASLEKGDRVVVTGRLTQRSWRDAEGVEHLSLEVDAATVGLDLARTAALAMRRTAPSQRPADEAPEVDAETPTPDDAWVSTGQVDAGTGEVLVARLVDVDAGKPEEPIAV